MNHSVHKIYTIEIKESKYVMVMNEKIQYKNVTCSQIGSYISHIIPLESQQILCVYLCEN